VRGPPRGDTRSASAEALRAAAVQDLDALLQSAATLRVELRGFEVALRRARGHLARGHAAEDLDRVIDITAARENLSVAAAEFQLHRHVSRLAVFRVQAAEGMSIGAIARIWGLSRQLVSRTLREDQALPGTEPFT
jgi:hypothetical protein